MIRTLYETISAGRLSNKSSHCRQGSTAASTQQATAPSLSTSTSKAKRLFLAGKPPEIASGANTSRQRDRQPAKRMRFEEEVTTVEQFRNMQQEVSILGMLFCCL